MPTVQLFENALRQWCYCSRNLGAFPTTSAAIGTGADDDNRIEVDSQKLQEQGHRQTPNSEKVFAQAISVPVRARTMAQFQQRFQQRQRQVQCAGQEQRQICGRCAERVSLPKRLRGLHSLFLLFHRNQGLLKLFGAILTRSKNVES